MKLFTISLCMFSFLISSVLGAENKGLLGLVIAGATKATSSVIKGALPLSYALDQNNTKFYTDTVQLLKATTIADFKKNTKLQDDVRSISSRSDRANHCIIDAIAAGNTGQLIQLCKANTNNIHPEVFKLVSQYFEEQKQDITTILGTTPPKPVENPTALIHQSDLDLVEKTRQLSLKILIAMNTNHIANLKDILETEQAYLPECIITAAKNHLKAIGATIATVISPKIIDLDSDEPEYVVGADPIAQEKTQSTANVPQITVTTTVEKTISTPTIATSVTATAQSSTQVATAQQATASTAQRPTGKKSGQNPRQHGMQQPQ